MHVRVHADPRLFPPPAFRSIDARVPLYLCGSLGLEIKRREPPANAMHPSPPAFSMRTTTTTKPRPFLCFRFIHIHHTTRTLPFPPTRTPVKRVVNRRNPPSPSPSPSPSYPLNTIFKSNRPPPSRSYPHTKRRSHPPPTLFRGSSPPQAAHPR